MKILVRLPNWLGDMVMSVAFIDQLYKFYPSAEVSVIVKKGLEQLLDYFPPLMHVFIFNKEESRGINGLFAYGNKIKKGHFFDLFFSLPNSFSSALIGYATGANKTIGYKYESRQFLLTDTYKKPTGIHRVDEYVQLLELFTSRKAAAIKVTLLNHYKQKQYVVININSEASSRRLTINKAVELVQKARNIFPEIVLIGSSKEKGFVDVVIQQSRIGYGIVNKAGSTSINELVQILAEARLVITTDSGPAHLANALGKKTIVLFGAGNERHTSPYNKENCLVTRLGELKCEPCERNYCKRFASPQCLEQLDLDLLMQLATNEFNGI